MHVEMIFFVVCSVAGYIQAWLPTTRSFYKSSFADAQPMDNLQKQSGPMLLCIGPEMMQIILLAISRLSDG
jgi:hypothetical protein